MCGLPGHGPGDLMDVVYDGDRVSLSNADTIGAPLRLTTEEALALVAALRALAGRARAWSTPAPSTARWPSSRQPPGESSTGGDVDGRAGGAAPIPPSSRPSPGALAGGRRLRMTYWVPARDEATERDVDPIRMFTADGVPYLVGWCRLVEDLRTFRLDRALEVSLTDDRRRRPR